MFPNNWIGRLQSITQLYAGHQKLSDVHRIMPEEIYRDLFRFAFVRNPYALVVSVFNFGKQWKDILSKEEQEKVMRICRDSFQHLYSNTCQKQYY